MTPLEAYERDHGRNRGGTACKLCTIPTAAQADMVAALKRGILSYAQIADCLRDSYQIETNEDCIGKHWRVHLRKGRAGGTPTEDDRPPSEGPSGRQVQEGRPRPRSGTGDDRRRERPHDPTPALMEADRVIRRHRRNRTGGGQ